MNALYELWTCFGCTLKVDKHLLGLMNKGVDHFLGIYLIPSIVMVLISSRCMANQSSWNWHKHRPARMNVDPAILNTWIDFLNMDLHF
jgi:hypothetical protein